MDDATGINDAVEIPGERRGLLYMHLPSLSIINDLPYGIANALEKGRVCV
jgi:hypothetical protein